MDKHRNAAVQGSLDRGISIVVIAVAMVFVMGMAGLSVDLASLYVGRTQAQRAADAAALAGAQTFAMTQGCASGIGGSISAACQALAMQRAEAAGNANLIAGVTPDIQDSDISFPSTSTSDPQIQVVAARDTTHGNPMPTFFVKIFGIRTANISAKATAEAYNATGEPNPVGSTCLKPWLLPNCDANNTTDQNPNCTNPSTAGYYINNGEIDDPSIIGQVITIKPGNPSNASGPSKFYPVYLPPGSVATDCPSCASGQGSSGSQSGDQYRQNIECCNTSTVVCGTNQVTAISGNMVGPSNQGVSCLIHQDSSGSGQDTFDPSTWTITAGSGTTALYGLSGTITSSDSIATLPIYDGSILCPGGSGGACTSPVNVDIIGFMQVFIKDVGPPNASVQAYVMSIVTCSSGVGGISGGGGGGAGGIVTPGGSAIPVRLIHQ